MTSARQIVRMIEVGLECHDDDTLREVLGTTVRRVQTYAEAGVLTRDAGLVITLGDGSQYDITIVRSRVAGDDDDGDDVRASMGCLP